MFWFTKDNEKLDKAVDDIGKKIDELIAERDVALKQLEHANIRIAAIFDSISDEDMVINFNAVNVFSIERNKKDDVPCTIVGFTLNDGDKQKHVEWYLYCSERVHKNIVESFNKHIKAISK